MMRAAIIGLAIWALAAGGVAIAQVEIANALLAAAAAGQAQFAKRTARTYDYASLARDPTRFTGQTVALRGKVIQILEEGINGTIRLNVTQGQYGWNDTTLASYFKFCAQCPRILEGDIVRIYGEYQGITTYKAVMGQTISLPHVKAVLIENQYGQDVINVALPKAIDRVRIDGFVMRRAEGGMIEITGTVHNDNDFRVENLLVICGDKSYASADVKAVIKQRVPAKGAITILATMGPINPNFPPSFCKIASVDQIP